MWGRGSISFSFHFAQGTVVPSITRLLNRLLFPVVVSSRSCQGYAAVSPSGKAADSWLLKSFSWFDPAPPANRDPQLVGDSNFCRGIRGFKISGSHPPSHMTYTQIKRSKTSLLRQKKRAWFNPTSATINRLALTGSATTQRMSASSILLSPGKMLWAVFPSYSGQLIDSL